MAEIRMTAEQILKVMWQDYATLLARVDRLEKSERRYKQLIVELSESLSLEHQRLNHLGERVLQVVDNPPRPKTSKKQRNREARLSNRRQEARKRA